MAKLSPIPGAAAGLRGRRRECGVLDRLIGALRAGESRALVVRGEPGAGKTALLDYAARRAADCRVVRAAGVQSEMELAFAGLHQVCAPMLDRLDRLPVPQRDALEIAFGISCGPAPDRFLIGRAAGPRRPVQPGNRFPVVHQPRHRRLPPAQGVHQARDQLAHPARQRPAQRPGHSAGLTYLENVEATFKPFGGRWLVLDAPVEVLEGARPGSVVLMEFPDMDAAKKWYHSLEYQKVLNLGAPSVNRRWSRGLGGRRRPVVRGSAGEAAGPPRWRARAAGW